MIRRLFLIMAIVICFSSVLWSVSAQDKLSEKFISYDNWLTFNYPSGWALDSEGDDYGAGVLLLGSSSKALQTMRSNSANNQSKTVPAGEAGIILMRSKYLNKLLKLTPEMTPAVVLKKFLGASFSLTSGDIQELILGGYPAVRLDSADKKSAGIFLIVDFGYNQRVLMVSSIAPKDKDKLEPTILSIAGSLKFGGDAQKSLIHDNPVWQVSWSPDGRFLGTREKDAATKQGIVHVWDSDKFEELYQAAADGYEWSPDSQRLLVWNANASSRILDADTGKGFAILPPASYARWSADSGRVLIASYQGGIVEVWDVKGNSGARIARIGVKTFFANWAKDDTVIVTSIAGLNEEWLTQVWDATTGNELLNVPDADHIVFNQDGTRALAALRSGSIQVYDLATQTQILSIPVKLEKQIFGLYIHNVNWRADDKVITANMGSCPPGTRNCTLDLWIWDAETGELLHRLVKDEPFRYAAWNPNGNQVLTLSRQPHRALLWDVTSGKMVFSFDLPDFAQGAIWNRDGSKFIIWSAEGMARLWNAKTGKLLITMPHDAEIDSIRWSEDENVIYTRTANGMLRTWDAQTGRVLLQVGAGGKADRDISAWRSYSPEDKQLVTWVSGAQGVRVWDNENILFFARVKFESDPLLTGDYLKQATDAIKNKEYDKALAILKHVEQLDPDLASIYNLRGVAYYQLKDTRRAIDEIKRAVQIDPTYVQGYVNLGDILRLAGDWSGAVKNYTRAIELSPDSAGIYNSRGATYFKWGETYLPKAIEDFSKAIELKPDYATAYENRGNMYYILKDFQKALDDYGEYVRLAGSKANQPTLERIAELEAKKK